MERRVPRGYRPARPLGPLWLVALYEHERREVNPSTLLLTPPIGEQPAGIQTRVRRTEPSSSLCVAPEMESGLGRALRFGHLNAHEALVRLACVGRLVHISQPLHPEGVTGLISVFGFMTPQVLELSSVSQGGRRIHPDERTHAL